MKASEIKNGDRVLWKGCEVTVIDAEPVWYRQSFFRRTIAKSARQTNAVLVKTEVGCDDVAPLRSLRPLPDASLLEQRKAVESAKDRVKYHVRPDREIVDALVDSGAIAAYGVVGEWQRERERLVSALEFERAKLAEMEAKR